MLTPYNASLYSLKWLLDTFAFFGCGRFFVGHTRNLYKNGRERSSPEANFLDFDRYGARM